MLEVREIVSKIVMLIGLFGFAWHDIKTKMIELNWLLLFGAVGFLLQWNVLPMEQILAGMLLGGIVLLAAWLSKESVGIGDGLLFIATGIFLGSMQNLGLILGSFFLAGVFSTGCLILKKKGRNDRVALGPFVLAAYVMFIL
ncbi:MAG: prepilin peptidase [Roseburia sp.]|nr:prepilin peptidase [Roseburia sp.]